MRPGPRRSISQTDIVATAFEILEEKGFAAVSVRGVAAALGLTPTALYTYFPSKNALQRAMVEELLADLDAVSIRDGLRPALLDDRRVPPTADSSAAHWRETVAVLAAALLARLGEHVGSLTLLTSGPFDGPNALALTERLIVAFTEAGLPLEAAARAARAVLAQVIGTAALEAAQRAAEPVPSEAQPLWSGVSSHPLADATAHLWLDADAAAEAARALDRLLDGLVPPRD